LTNAVVLDIKNSSSSSMKVTVLSNILKYLKLLLGPDLVSLKAVKLMEDYNKQFMLIKQ
jgi:hypothetical protein